jgi:hypothetical protein
MTGGATNKAANSIETGVLGLDGLLDAFKRLMISMVATRRGCRG